MFLMPARMLRSQDAFRENLLQLIIMLNFFFSLPVEEAAFTSPRLVVAFNLFFMKNFLAPPVTDIISFGGGTFQKLLSISQAMDGRVLWSSRIYYNIILH